VILVHDDKDPALPYQASLKATAPIDHKNITLIKMQELDAVDKSSHLRPYTMQEIEALATAIRAIW
jgi:hypothetical protein